MITEKVSECCYVPNGKGTRNWFVFHDYLFQYWSSHEYFISVPKTFKNKWSFFSGELKLDGILLISFSFLAITTLAKLFSNFPALIQLISPVWSHCWNQIQLHRVSHDNSFHLDRAESKTKAFPEHMLFNVTTFLFWCWFKLFRSLKGNLISPLSYLQIWNKPRALFKVWM